MSIYGWTCVFAFILCCRCQFQNKSNEYFRLRNNSAAVFERESHELITLFSKTPKINVSAEYDEAASAKFITHLEHSSFIFGLMMVANKSNVNPLCYNQLKTLRRGIIQKKPWAMKVLDASGTKPSGFMFGQNFWFGSREACGAVQQPVEITLSKDFARSMYDGIITQVAPFNMNYRVIYLRHNSPWQVEIKLMSEQVIHIGLCLPTACASAEVQKLSSYYVRSGNFIENEIYDMQPEVLYMKNLQLQSSFYEKQSFKMIGAVLIFTSLMLLLAGLYRLPTLAIGKGSTLQSTTVKESNEENYSLFEKIQSFIKCFDLIQNYRKLFQQVNLTSSEIPVINGLRSVCAIWIMFFHVTWFMYFTVNNKTFLISHAERIFFQYVSSAPLLVDVFFTISGFLHIYNFLRRTKQMATIRENNFMQNAKLFFKMLFHRYLRLAPLYLVIMGVVDLMYAYMGDISVYHINERFDEICSQHWLRNVLFIQNFFDHQNMCLNWSWSLACEMQFFIFATVLLFAYVRHPKLVKLTVFAILGSNFAWTYASGLRSKFLLSFDSAFATGTDVYINPFVRVMPYILGAMTAWYFVENQCQFQMTEMKERCLWNLSILIYFSCIYSTIKRDMTYMQSISLFVIGRLLFSLSVCWMIVGSATGRGSCWSRLLEANIFQHLNRLSYAFYLLNPFVIAVFFSFTSVSTHADPLMLCVLTSGFVIIVYLISIAFSLVFEMPYCNLSTLLLRKGKQKTS